jgi:hypothetical protein
MQIKELPKQIQKKVFEKQIEQGNLPDKDLTLFHGKEAGNFDWNATEEGWYFWNDVSFKMYEDFYKKYPKDKTPVWLKLVAIFCIVFIVYIISCELIEMIK